VAFSPAVPHVPSQDAEPPRSPPRRPHGQVAPVKQSERFRIPGRFGDISASRLTGILWTLDRGYLEDWADLVEYAISSDADLQSMYTTTITRITQATWKVIPNKYGNQSDAKLAAELCNEQLGRLQGWRLAKTTLLHAIGLGYQPMEKEWAEPNSVDRKNFVRALHFRHAHRFRLDTQYKYRLYDRGSDANLLKHSPYGKVLDPNRWIVHKHQAVAGYATTAGLMRAGIWTWMFKRWAEKGYVRVLERNGAPYIYFQCTDDTPQAVRDKMVEFLEDLHTEKAAVVEGGGSLQVIPGAAITGTPLHELYLNKANASFAKLWLGSSDLTDPGANGSNAAVNTRAGVTADPRMVAYGLELGETVSDQLFKQVLEMNRHLFGGRLAPVPTYEANTASDEVQVDKQDLAEQSGGSITVGALDDTLDTGTPDPMAAGDAAAAASGGIQPVAASAEKAADTALNGAQVASMKDLVIAAATGQMPRDSAKAIIKRAFQMDDAAADEVLGSIGKGFQPDATPDPEGVPMTASDPKALSTLAASESAPKRKRSTRKPVASSLAQTTLPISSHSARVLAETLRGVSDDPEH